MRQWRGKVLRASGAVLGVLLLGAGCAQLIGIEETTLGAAGMAGSMGGQMNNAPGGGGTSSAGRGGGAAQQAGRGGSGGTGAAMGGSSSGACTNDEARCGAAGREQCVGGVWQAMPCPLTTPACEGAGACVLRGPELVQVAISFDSSFYIDATEVTVAHYGEFMAAKGGDTSGQPPECDWNTEYFDPNRAPEAANLPITYVDWCDARAYCEWAGKHLCGNIAGGVIDAASAVDEAQSQWFLACGGPSGSQYLNNNTNNSECNTPDGFSGLVEVGSLPLCVARYPGVFDLVGNAAEWIDSCSPGADGGVDPRKDFCLSMGGGIYGASRYYCDTVFEDVTRDLTNYTFGFRCCSG